MKMAQSQVSGAVKTSQMGNVEEVKKRTVVKDGVEEWLRCVFSIFF